jgi:hypothetical protein
MGKGSLRLYPENLKKNFSDRLDFVIRNRPHIKNKSGLFYSPYQREMIQP